MSYRPYAEWTTEALKDYEESLYDREVAGEDVWFERDQVLWELTTRGPNRRTETAHKGVRS